MLRVVIPSRRRVAWAAWMARLSKVFTVPGWSHRSRATAEFVRTLQRSPTGAASFAVTRA
jgi:hypothetical protein